MNESTLYTENWYTLKQVFSLKIQIDILQLNSKLLHYLRKVNYNFEKKKNLEKNE
jgi:hypothetical protein